MAKNNPEYIIVHHTGTSRDTTTFRGVDNYHKRKWNFKSSLGHYIGYQYFIEADGKVTQGRADTDAGAHTKEQRMNYRSIGICLAGHFNREMPSESQVKSLAKLIASLALKYKIAAERIVPHRHFKPTSCYGTNLADAWASSLVRDVKSELIKKLEEALQLAKQL